MNPSVCVVNTNAYFDMIWYSFIRLNETCIMAKGKVLFDMKKSHYSQPAANKTSYISLYVYIGNFAATIFI